MADYKLLMNEDYVPYMPLRTQRKTPDAPTTIWDAELSCRESNESIGCWPNLSPCLFNVREDPCEYNNLAYYMPQLVETFMYKLSKYNESVKTQTRRKRSIQETVLYQRTVDKLRESRERKIRNDL